MAYFGYILLSLAVLLVMVLIHELGHYTAAKILGFTVEEFSVGFGPKLISKKKKNGEVFSLRLLPLGGYCAFLGENEEIEETPPPPPQPFEELAEENNNTEEQNNTDNNGTESDPLTKIMHSSAPAENEAVEPRKNAIPFSAQKPWKRIIVLLGGVTFNFVSAIIFSIIFIWVVGTPAVAVTEVYADPITGENYSVLQKGDVVLGLNGEDITIMTSFDDLKDKVGENESAKIKILRDGKTIEQTITRKKITVTDENGNTSEYLGFGVAMTTHYINANAANAFKYCVPYTFKLSWMIIGSFFDLIAGNVPITSVSGPVGSIKLMADVSKANPLNILILLPLLASNLAIFNLLPFPALDGAQVIFTVIEWIRRKPIKRKIQSMINMIGLGVLLLFVLIVDILSFAL